jgi:hypothetical protein
VTQGVEDQDALNRPDHGESTPNHLPQFALIVRDSAAE